jgi:hypothetical protein
LLFLCSICFFIGDNRMQKTIFPVDACDQPEDVKVIWFMTN